MHANETRLNFDTGSNLRSRNGDSVALGGRPHLTPDPTAAYQGRLAPRHEPQRTRLPVLTRCSGFGNDSRGWPASIGPTQTRSRPRAFWHLPAKRETMSAAIEALLAGKAVPVMDDLQISGGPKPKFQTDSRADNALHRRFGRRKKKPRDQRSLWNIVPPRENGRLRGKAQEYLAKWRGKRRGIGKLGD